MARVDYSLGLLVTLTAAACGADWVQFRGHQGQGLSSENGLPTTWSGTQNVVWKVELPGAGTSSPIFVGNRIYLTAYSGFKVPGQSAGSMDSLKRQVLCLNRADGKQI